MIVFTPSAFIFSESHTLTQNLAQSNQSKPGENKAIYSLLSKLCCKFAEEWLPKAKILGPADEQAT